MIKVFGKLSQIRLFLNVFILILLGIFVFLGVVVYQVSGKVKQVKKDVEIARLEISYVEDLNREFLSARSAIQKIESDEKNFLTLMPTRNEVLHNIEFLEALAERTANEQSIVIRESPPDLQPPSQTGNSANKSKAAKKSIASNVESVDYILTLEGSFMGLMQYLQLLEKQPFLTSLKSLEVSSEQTMSSGSSSLTNTGLIETTVVGTFYYLKE